MSLAHPLWLLAIVPALALAALELRRRWPATRWRRIATIGCRLAIIAALATAAAEPRLATERRSSTVVFLIDRSASIADDSLSAAWTRAAELRDSLASGQQVAVVLFDATPEVAIAPGDAWTPRLVRTATRDATDLAAAIRLGLGLIPPNAGGHLVVLGDGHATAGDLRAAATEAIARGIAISAVPSGVVRDDPAVAAVVLDDDRVRSGATLKGHVDIDAGGVIGRGRVTVKVGATEVLSADVDLDGKHIKVPFTYALPSTQDPGVLPVEATLVPTGVDRDTTNDRGSSALVVERPPNIAIIDGDEGGASALAEVLRAERMNVNIISATSGSAPDLLDTDLVVLANAPVRAGSGTAVVDDEFGDKLVRWVNDGGGLLVLGGPSALDGHYAANRIADALPVEIEPMTPAIDSSATVIVILDQSGSMGAPVGGRTKLALAAEGATAAIRLLRSFDRVGVMAVQDWVQWLVTVQQIGDSTSRLEAKVREVEVGGNGIDVYKSLIAAQKEMLKSTTPIKHIILFSDTTDAAEQVKGISYGWAEGRPNSFDVARELRTQGVTLSVIGVGNGRDNDFDPAKYRDDEDDTDFLRELASVGGGRYYRTTDAKQLRGLFIQDARRLLSNSARDEDITLTPLATHAALDGIDLTEAPALHGFQQLKPRPAAQVVVEEHMNHNPIFTRWPYGLGEVTVWASDAGARWATDWRSWEGHARFWTQLVRASLRRHEGDRTAIETEVSGGIATVRVVRRDERAGATTPQARVVQQGATRPLSLRVIEPGTYEATVELADASPPTVEIVDQGKVVAHRTIVRPPSRELAQRGSNVDALGKLASSTGGTLSPTTIAATGRPITRATSLAMWFLLLAILLLPLDAGLRRVARG